MLLSDRSRTRLCQRCVWPPRRRAAAIRANLRICQSGGDDTGRAQRSQQLIDRRHSRRQVRAGCEIGDGGGLRYGAGRPRWASRPGCARSAGRAGRPRVIRIVNQTKITTTIFIILIAIVKTVAFFMTISVLVRTDTAYIVPDTTHPLMYQLFHAVESEGCRLKIPDTPRSQHK